MVNTVNVVSTVAEPPLIELRGIRKRYGGGAQPAVEVLRGIDLDIRAGEFVAIVGASGSGKSTLMNLLGCLDRPSEGSYRFAGKNVSALGADELAWLRREAFGFVFQGYHLIATESARENVEVPAIYAGACEGERAARATALLARLGMADKLDNRPAQLSGGQQQRVSIARALMNGGRIILADEPTGALDSKSGAEVMVLLNELADAGHTIVLITHDRGVAAQARRVIEIRDGTIVADCGHDNTRPAANEKQAAAVLPAFDMSRAAGDSGASFTADLREAARTAWRGMRLNRSRTGLTLLGIVIGVASVIVMLAVGEGARQRVVQQMGTLGTTIMYLGSRAPASGGPARPLTQDDLDAVAELPDVGHVMPVIGDPITVRHGNADREVYVFASSNVMHRGAPVARGAGALLQRRGRPRPGAAGGAGPQGARALLSRHARAARAPAAHRQFALRGHRRHGRARRRVGRAELRRHGVHSLPGGQGAGLPGADPA
jgi:macrolide transport system ATP-binding/permease protein